MQSITDVSLTLPSLSEVIAVATLRAGFNSAVVVIGTSFLGIASGIVGTFALLRKRALMGDALAHSSLPGLALAFILSVYVWGQERSLPVLLAGAVVSGVAGVLTVQFLVRYTRLSEDTAIGAVLSVYFGLGIVLLSYIQGLGTGAEGGLQHFIYGQTAAMHRSDALLTAAVAVFSVFCGAAFLKEFRLVCFDSEFAAVQGWPVGVLDLMMMTLVVLVTVIGLQSVGLILIVAMLVVPAAAARFWTERFDVMTGASAFLGGLSAYLGSVASSLLPRLPAGAVIVLVAGVLFTVSFLFAPKRGLLFTLARRIGLQMRIAEDHLLRFCYEKSEVSAHGAACAISSAEVRKSQGWGRAFFLAALFYASIRGLVSFAWVKNRLEITPAGWEAAKRLTRNHRLWEEYLVSFGHVTTSHVDYSADIVEHVLASDVVRELEAALKNKGLLPERESELPSVHPLEGR